VLKTDRQQALVTKIQEISARTHEPGSMAVHYLFYDATTNTETNIVLPEVASRLGFDPGAVAVEYHPQFIPPAILCVGLMIEAVRQLHFVSYPSLTTSSLSGTSGLASM